MKSKASKKSKPAWATTEKQLEDEKEAEIDELLEFAYELDYDKYMDDFEIRQVFSIIKDRVNEIKQDQDWKQNIADEWNQAADVPGEQAPSRQHSVYSYSKYQNQIQFNHFIIYIVQNLMLNQSDL